MIKKTALLMSIVTLAYLGLNALVYYSEGSSESFSKKDLDPSMSIHSVKGTAKETILLTPNLEHPYQSTNFISPLVGYGLELRPSRRPQLIPTGEDMPIYMDISGGLYSWSHISKTTGKSSFVFDGKTVTTPEYYDFHDQVIHPDGSFTFMEYLPDRSNRSLHLVLKRIDEKGRVLWSLNSEKYISKDNYVKYIPPINNDSEAVPLKVSLQNTRDQYSSLILNLVGGDLYKSLQKIRLPLYKRSIPIFSKSAGLIDAIHANSIQYLDYENYILVSARHLDTVFIIDIKTGSIVWSLGGPASRFTKNRVIGDPRGGFSHQHTARVYNTRLYIYDNANIYPDAPSRAVVYTFDMKNPNNCRFIFEYLEPYAKRRLSM
ncbi:MAG: arylsulfotransferase family protein, partial [Holophagaceae bacterium]